MQDHVTSAASDIAQAANAKVGAVAATNTTVGAGLYVAAEKPEMIEGAGEVGKYLATTPFPILPFLSYTEVFAGIAAIYLVWQFSTSFYDRVIVKIINWSNRNGQ